MPLLLSSEIIREKNKLEGGGTFIVLLEIDVPGLDEPIRVTSDSVETTWNGATYAPFPFEIAEVTDDTKGQIPNVELRVSNVTRALEKYVQEYDYYCKLNGYREVEAKLMVVHSEHLDEPSPIVEYVFTVTKITSTPLWMTFTLGARNTFGIRFPVERIMKAKCRYKVFKGPLCGYSGSETWCDRTLARCKELGNQERFGGFPGVGRLIVVE